MARHIVINPDVAVFTTLDKAFLDVAGETASNVTYTVYPAVGGPQTATVPMNAKNFATSPDLFGLSAKKTALIVATTTDPVDPSVAVLRQVAGQFREAVTIPSSNRMLGTAFNVPIGEGGGNVFIGNPNQTEAAVVLRYGNSSSAVAGEARVPALGVVKLKLTQTEANLLVAVTNGQQVVVQAVLCNRFLVVLPIGPAV
jgi:hypothetical protein